LELEADKTVKILDINNQTNKYCVKQETEYEEVKRYRILKFSSVSPEEHRHLVINRSTIYPSEA
jgi:hypothetical protein